MKRSRARILLYVCVAALHGCDSAPVWPAPPLQQQAHHIALRLERTGHPRFPLARPDAALPPELERPMSWHWRGTYADAVALLAGAAGYTPVIPPAPGLAPEIAVDLNHVTLHDLIDEVAAAGADYALLQTDIAQHELRVAWRRRILR
ncbi:hypothetical protein AA12717_0909 [Gluconacetobacter sacchari DSM 12717]|uniref:DotD/TraH family lipoprotein n=2 Tax=Gluconacetobacter sacchari TaxID=92759 RepID=A0A7W4IF40_9PROT|nr:DotD/TraH family lipoprotein [Gluconacetobacter sacchari]MBB2161582.1 DotD/TraH family lipoprotein [Gluconacetobacter sacchari]GBQ21520.1 hypothetical protein AA12717_0909 [Gluconacetobacter sacchari DSM 12717]